MDDREAAARDLERIRAIMERTRRYSHLSATAAFSAGALAIAGVWLSVRAGADFSSPESVRPLALIWGSVLVAALAQGLAFTMAEARRRGDPFWGPLTRQVAVAILPAFLVGATVTAFGLRTGQLEILPPFWSLAHGSSLVALGLFAGRRIQAVGLLFLLGGAAALLFWRDQGLRVMLGVFGGGHLLLGMLIVWKRRRSAA